MGPSKLHASAKASSFTESVIRDMTRLANLHGAINLGQGFPDFAAPQAAEGCGCSGDRRRSQPVPDHVGRACVPRSDRREVPARLRHDGRSRDRDLRNVRVHRGDDRDDARRARSRRRGRDLRAVLRELRSGLDPVRRRAEARHPASARLDVRRGRAARGVHRPDPCDRDQLAQQPHRQGVHPRGAVADRRALHAARRDRDHRRDLRAHHLRRREPRPDRHAGRHGRAHRDDQRPVEDLLGDGMARGVGDRVSGADGRHPLRARLPHRCGRGAAAGGGHHRARTPGQLLRGRVPPSTPNAAT